MAALTSPGVGITVNVSRRDSQEYLRLHQLEPYLEDAAVYALYAEDDLPPAEPGVDEPVESKSSSKDVVDFSECDFSSISQALKNPNAFAE